MDPVNPLVRNAALNGYVELVRSLGADPLPLLRATGLSAPDLAAQDRWISATAVAELLELSAAATGREDFGIRLAEIRRVSNFGPVGLAAREEPDVRSAVELLIRYAHLHNEGLEVRLTEATGMATVTLGLTPGLRGDYRQAIELIVGGTDRILRGFLPSQWQPVSICFAHRAPADLTTHHRVLGHAIAFDQEFNGIIFYASDLDAPNAMSDPLLRPYVRQYLSTIGAPRHENEADQIRELIDVLLPTGRCSATQVAHTLGVNRRTIHRHLSRSNETFSSVLNSVRTQQAERYVGQQHRAVTEVAQLLGFSAPSAFSRWFRDQFGSSPQAWRTARNHDHDSPS